MCNFEKSRKTLEISVAFEKISGILITVYGYVYLMPHNAWGVSAWPEKILPGNKTRGADL